MIPEIECVPLGPSLHFGRIGGVSICMWKPLFMTSGLDDRSLRIWNYEQESLEVCKEFQEDIYGISIHPTGLFAVVGFSDKLRFLTITIDDLIKTREFHIRSCKLCSFSRLGHLFAATNGNVIQVYSTVSFEQLFVLKGHSGVVSVITNWSSCTQAARLHDLRFFVRTTIKPTCSVSLSYVLFPDNVDVLE